MIAKTISFANPGRLTSKDEQLVWDSADGIHRTFPIEDLGFVILESNRISISSHALERLAFNNVALVVCDQSHMPKAQLLSLNANTLTQEVVSGQLSATDAVNGRIWRQLCRQKIINQAAVLKKLDLPNVQRLLNMAESVKNHDPANIEGQAARLYFRTISEVNAFKRDPEGGWPNPALNYGYAIVRAAVARALVGIGLLCVKGIHHHNRYNAFCLADDMMEPFRPFVDQYVFGEEAPFDKVHHELNHEVKAALLATLTCDVKMGDVKRPLMIAATYAASSLAKWYSGECKTLVLPEFVA